MTEKRFTTVELPKPNKWGIWYDGAYLSTYQVCTLLNEYVDVKKENEQLKIFLEALKEELSLANRDNDALEKENEQLKQQIKDMKIRFKRKYDHEFDEIVDELW